MSRRIKKEVFDIVREGIYSNCDMQMHVDMESASKLITENIYSKFTTKPVGKEEFNEEAVANLIIELADKNRLITNPKCKYSIEDRDSEIKILATQSIAPAICSKFTQPIPSVEEIEQAIINYFNLKGSKIHVKDRADIYQMAKEIHAHLKKGWEK